jgi:hypothetical protein
MVRIKRQSGVAIWPQDCGFVGNNETLPPPVRQVWADFRAFLAGEGTLARRSDFG